MIETSHSESQLNYIGDSYYLYSVSMINKGLEMMYIRIFTFFGCIDFSNNKFYGEIPRAIGDLGSLIVLNLSSNNFSGHIPSSLGNLIELESLDLSNNKLCGEIPHQLTRLTFLEYLNSSENQLVGPIPQAGQIETFSNSSFEGNWGLCGLPLSKKCETLLPPSEYSEESGDSILSGLTWKTVAKGYGYGLIIGLMIGFITTSSWPCLMLKKLGVIPPRRLR
ncbi:putative receptor like protein 25 [Ziziphus jujuba]|uniref:Receptor like protein 25 n=1 Tax=Ziziphus jujuba TaxID=326968 RepID=A0ABM4A2P6_ZIZJJ|nr:putative receptor like protein 25 [Ziziphus jujuba]